jgi:thiamine-phosphate pyrophosphorylase
MHRRQSLPRLWLMTDERQGSALLPAIAGLPRGAGIVFRHYSLPPAARRALWDQVRAAVRGRGIVLIAAGSVLPGGQGCHNRRGCGIRTCSAHNLRELRAAERAGADLVFLSPVFATRSHAGAPSLGAARFARLARIAKVPVVALGGMSAGRAQTLQPGGAAWAGIDAFTAVDG